MIMLLARVFGDLQGRRTGQRTKVSHEPEEFWPDQAFSAAASSGPTEEIDQDSEPEFLELLVSQELLASGLTSVGPASWDCKPGYEWF